MKQFLQILALSVVVLVSETVGSTVFIADYGMSKMIELSTKPPYCIVQMDRGKIREMLLSSDPRRVRQMSDESIENLERVCKNNKVRTAHQGGFIYPGTKWCGPGTVARNFSDLGFHYKEDMCCREHDNCPISLAQGECRQGICNNSPFTRSHCDCDAGFRKCLQNVNTETANTIGAIFFNVIQVICFKERTPCTQWQSSNSHNNVEGFIAKQMNKQCNLQFNKSGRYIGSQVRTFERGNKKEYYINKLFRKLRLL